MNAYTATELAYKNGYKAGIQELAKRLKLEKFEINDIYENIFYVVEVDVIDSYVAEMTEK